MVSLPLPGLDDPESDKLPDHLPAVVDAHVHIFPDDLFNAVWAWFDQFGWPVRYRLYTDALVRFLLARGVRHIVALQYAHKPGVAADLNRYMADLTHGNPAVTGMATVFPGESGAMQILETAFAAGLKGVKLHRHVQCFTMDAPGMHAIYRCCCDHALPLVIHAGREPKSPAYACDPYDICHWTHAERVLKAYPDLKLLVPHLGADEFEAYEGLLERFDNLWLDTTMVLANYLPMKVAPDISRMRPDRLLYGSDFPNIPYAWDREIHQLAAMDLGGDVTRMILSENAANLYQFDIGATEMTA